MAGSYNKIDPSETWYITKKFMPILEIMAQIYYANSRWIINEQSFFFVRLVIPVYATYTQTWIKMIVVKENYNQSSGLVWNKVNPLCFWNLVSLKSLKFVHNLYFELSICGSVTSNVICNAMMRHKHQWRSFTEHDFRCKYERVLVLPVTDSCRQNNDSIQQITEWNKKKTAQLMKHFYDNCKVKL